jgi:hypothetical protein
MSEASAPPRRRRFHFGLRSLLLLVALLAILFAWVGAKINHAREQREVVAAIRSLGGGVYFDDEYVRPGEFHSSRPPERPTLWRRLLGDDSYHEVVAVFDEGGSHGKVTDDVIRRCIKVAHLKMVSLEDCKGITDAGIEGLGRHTGIEEVWLGGTRVTDIGLAQLASLKKIEKLSLSGCEHITGAGLRHLQGLNKLKFLGLSRCVHVTDVGLRHLKGLTALSHLWLDGCDLSDAGLAELQGLSDLRTLTLTGRHISDEGLAHLSRLTKLQDLRLFDADVTDKGLAHLSGLTSLEKIELQGCTQITGAGLQSLAGLQNVKSLDFSGCVQFAAAALEHLEAFPNLWMLDLNDCPKITDAATVHLARLKSVTLLGLNGTQVTRIGEAELKKSLPGCVVGLRGSPAKKAVAERPVPHSNDDGKPSDP